MKNLINLSLGFCLVITFFSCKKGEDLMPAGSAAGNIVQSAPATAGRSIPAGSQYSIGDLADYVILGVHHTDVSLEEDIIVTGKVGVGPAGNLKFNNAATVNGNIYTHNGVQIDGGGILNGTLYTNQNLASLNGDVNQFSHAAEVMVPTVVLNDVTTGMTLAGNGSMNVINMHKIKLDNNDNLVLSGNSTEVFIINVEEDFDLTGNAKIITAGGALSSNVLFNLLGHDKKATSKNSNIINATILAADREVEFGNLNGQIISGGKKLKIRKNAVINYIPFGG